MRKIEIGLSKFIEFATKQGPAKLSVVRTLKNQEAQEYSTAIDYWQKLRKSIIEMHRNDYPFSYLDHVVAGVEDKKKNQYANAVKEYKKLFKKLDVDFFEPGKAHWSYENLFVKSTPELGLIVNGVPHLIKLYLRDDDARFDRWSMASILTLLSEATYSNQPDEETVFSVINVKRSKWVSTSIEQIKPDYETVLRGEAAHFIQLYNLL